MSLKQQLKIQIKILYALAIIYIVLALISFILRDIYFIDALLSVPTVVFLVYMWGSQRFTLLPEIFVTLAFAVALVRLIPALSCRANHKKNSN